MRHNNEKLIQKSSEANSTVNNMQAANDHRNVRRAKREVPLTAPRESFYRMVHKKSTKLLSLVLIAFMWAANGTPHHAEYFSSKHTSVPHLTSSMGGGDR